MSEPIIISRKDAIAQELKYFYTGKPCKHGHLCQRLTSSGNCILCSRVYSKRWAGKNPEAIKLKSRKYSKQAVEHKRRSRLKDPEGERIKARDRYRKNREKIIGQVRAWQIANPGKKSAQDAKRRGWKHDWYTNCPNDLRREQAIYLECERITRETGIEHHVDHIWPLSKGGPHLWYNLQIIPAAQNLSKHDKFTAEDKALFASRLMGVFNGAN